MVTQSYSNTILKAIQTHHLINGSVNKIIDTVKINTSVWKVQDKDVTFLENDKECVKILLTQTNITLTINETSGNICNGLYEKGLKNAIVDL